MQKNNKGFVPGLVVLLIMTIAGVGFGVRSIIRANTVAPFQKEIDTYLSGPSAGFRPNTTAASKGKVITVDAGKREIDYVYFDLPDEIRAAKPEEVGTVAVLSWGEEPYKGLRYSDGLLATVQTCVVKVYRKEGMVPLSEKRFVGGPPPEMRKRSASGSGPKPTGEVVDYLKTVYVQGLLKK